ncbi:Ig-like domain-containing protein [Candidatus Chloroploca sp. M-50]|uniref:Ig-like domain-containing protein n=1 Tax=Candidatus Chloroploca mongolica TaxID=2528176 RepID=A0ABS4D9C6_9CHLR|nr:Ig-like domain-containing protein [Candidatus Chloroploca mongolica]MBP1466049.1 Ig-like domain-containing protein [Candidatus Chloroploca mongolica]
MNQIARSTMTTFVLILAVLLSALPPAPIAVYAQASSPGQPVAQPAQSGSRRVYLPVMVRPPGPPSFLLSNPVDGATIGGNVVVAVQVLSPGSVSQVSFQAGGVDLGTDTTPADGFTAFLDVSQLPAGPVTITATAQGPQGEASQSVAVTAQPNPPSTGTVDAQGGVFGSASGATITVPPGAVSSSATIAIRERSQAEVTAESGIAWDDIGVTFLGDIVVTSDQPLELPVEISTVGFANRIQPGQAVVTYNLLPDQDGDGIGELVVVSTAEVAPNGAIISTPASAVTVQQVTPDAGSSSLAQGGTLSGTPGTLLTIRGTGFNPVSINGNVATFRSTGSGAVAAVPAIVSESRATGEQTLRVVVPALPAGPATLTLLNVSSGQRSDPIEVVIEAATPLIRPAAEIIDQWLAASITYLGNVPTASAEERANLDQVMVQFGQMRNDLAALVAAGPNAVERQALNDVALLIQNSDIFTVNAALAQYDADAKFNDFLSLLGGVVGTLGAAAALATATTALAAFAAGAAIGLGIAATLYFACKLARGGSCFGDPPSSPGGGCTVSPSAGGSPGGGSNRQPGTTSADLAQSGGSRGIGGAPPPGGNGCGSAGGGSNGPSTSLAQTGGSDLAGRYLIKVFPQAGGRALTPFTGATDPAGYFFLPFIPEGEPFRAVAVDTVTGATASFDGLGPATGASVLMFFNFAGAEDNRFPISFGDTVSDGVPAEGAGNLENPGAFDIYTFEAEADRQVIFNLLSAAPELSNTRWKLTDPQGATVFDRVLGSTTNIMLRNPGTYRLTVGDDTSGGSGIYSFQLIGVPLPDRFALNIGDVVDDGVPGPGAGNIEEPYVQDIYTVTVTSPQVVFLDVQARNGLTQLNWVMEAPDGTVIFDAPLFTEDRGPLTITQTGTYRIAVGGEPNTTEVGTYRFKLWEVPAPQEFAIVIGDAVDDGVPGPGAGNIETPGAQDIYTFTATTGDAIFVDVQARNGLTQLNWRFLAPDGTVIFDHPLFTEDRGPLTLPQTGTYRIEVGGEANVDEVGTYGFQLWEVPAPQEFAIAIGDVIADGQPGPGAGNIETPGAQDIYTFTATTGEVIFLDVQARSGLTQLNWRFLAPDGTVIFDHPLFTEDRGPLTLPQTGTYRIEVGGEANVDEVGTYGFQLWEVPAPQEFAIAIGDVIADGQPGPGAGNIETPGAQDIYTFTATTGDVIFLDVQARSGLTQLNWRFLAPDGTVIFDHPLFTEDRGPLTLPQTGIYRIEVGGEANEQEVGTYRFQLWAVPAPQTFAIAFGDTIADGDPAVGAGNIETPGVQDIYTFSATNGQVIFLDLLARNGLTQLNWRLEDPNGAIIFDAALFTGNRGPLTLDATGTYRLVVGGEANEDEVGTYSFTLRTQ